MITYNIENVEMPDLCETEVSAWVRRVAESYGKITAHAAQSRSEQFTAAGASESYACRCENRDAVGLHDNLRNCRWVASLPLLCFQRPQTVFHAAGGLQFTARAIGIPYQ